MIESDQAETKKEYLAWTNYKNFGQIEKLKIGEQRIFTDGEMEKWTEMQKLESLQGTDRADCCIFAIFKEK